MSGLKRLWMGLVPVVVLIAVLVGMANARPNTGSPHRDILKEALSEPKQLLEH